MNTQAFPDMHPYPTLHCITGAMRRVFDFGGVDASEELLLGLGAGVGFVYWHMRGSDPFLGGRANVGRPGEEGLERTAARRLGVGVEMFKSSSAARAEKYLLDELQAGRPAMLQVDMGFLPYFNFPTEFHFGGHAVVACGFDPQAGLVWIADREPQFYPVSLADVAKARGSTYKPFTPQNTAWRFDFSTARPPQPAEVWEAILQTAANMVNPPITNLGLKGIQKAVQRVLTWPKEMDAEALKSACFSTYIFIDAAGGTGGGIFRYMYGRFLVEAAALTGDPRLAELSPQFLEAGDLWQVVAGLCHAASEQANPAASLPEIARAIKEAGACETPAWQTLHGLAAAN